MHIFCTQIRRPRPSEQIAYSSILSFTPPSVPLAQVQFLDLLLRLEAFAPYLASPLDRHHVDGTKDTSRGFPTLPRLVPPPPLLAFAPYLASSLDRHHGDDTKDTSRGFLTLPSLPVPHLVSRPPPLRRTSGLHLEAFTKWQSPTSPRKPSRGAGKKCRLLG